MRDLRKHELSFRATFLQAVNFYYTDFIDSYTARGRLVMGNNPSTRYDNLVHLSCVESLEIERQV